MHGTLSGHKKNLGRLEFFSTVNHFSPLLRLPRSQLTPAVVETVLSQLESSPSRALVLLSHLTSLPPPSLPPYCHTLSSTLPLLLSPSVSRRVQEAYLSLWTKLNLVVPRRYACHILRNSCMYFQFLFVVVCLFVCVDCGTRQLDHSDLRVSNT